MVMQKPITKIAQQFGISDSAVINRCKSLGVKTPGRGYWQKLAAQS